MTESPTDAAQAAELGPLQPSGRKGLVNETRQGGSSEVGVFHLIGRLALDRTAWLEAGRTRVRHPLDRWVQLAGSLGPNFR